MIGNTNASRMGGSTLKVLNVVQNGTLSRSGAKISGFSSGNYLTLCNRLSNDFLNLDSNQYAFNLSRYLNSANTWKIVFNIDVRTLSGTDQGIISDAVGDGWSTWLSLLPNGKVRLGISNTSAQAYSVGEVSSSVSLELNKNYYISAEFTGSGYRVGVSLDDINWEYSTLLSTQEKITRTNMAWKIGGNFQQSAIFPFNGDINLDKCYISINDNYVWHGVEEIQL